MTKIMLAVCAAFLSVVAIVATEAAVDDPGGAQSAGPVPGSPAATAASLPAADQPTVDYTLDLDNGLMTPLPDAIINSLGPTYVGVSTYDWDFSRYAYSHEASKLAYIGEDRVGSHDPHLFVASIDGTGIRQLTDHPPICCAATPAWSPDGTKIVFDTAAAGFDLWVIPSSGGTATQLTTDPAEDRHADWSPDGSTIVFESDRTGGGTQVWSIPATGGIATQLTTTVANNTAPTYSYTGTQISFTSDRTGDNEIFLMPASGEPGATQLSCYLGASDALSDWSPTAPFIAFVTNRGGTNDVSILTVPIPTGVNASLRQSSWGKIKAIYTD